MLAIGDKPVDKGIRRRAAHTLRFDIFGDFGQMPQSSGAKDEVLLTATAQNLRRLAKLLCRAPPAPVACLA